MTRSPLLYVAGAFLALGCAGPTPEPDPDLDLTPVVPEPDPELREDLEVRFIGDTDRQDLVVQVYSLSRFNRMASAPVVDGEASLRIPGPDDAAFLSHPEVQGVRYVPLVFATLADADRDGQHEEGETYVGSSARWGAVSYLEGDAEVLAAQGWRAGWNVLNTDGQPLDPDAMALPLDLLPTDRLRLAGTTAIDGPALRVAVVPLTLGAPGVEPLVDLPIGAGTWEIELVGPPPENHYDPDVYPGMVAEAPIAYRDIHEPPGPLGDLEGALYPVCYGTGHVILGWLKPPVSIFEAIDHSLVGAHSGWEAWSLEADDVLPREARDQLTIVDGDCG